MSKWSQFGIVVYICVWSSSLVCAMPSNDAIQKPSRSASLQKWGAYWFARKGCEVCHTTDGKDSFGGSLQGLYGRKVQLEKGQIVLRDEAYFRTKILVSSRLPLKNGMNVMPLYRGALSKTQLRSIIAFIRSLKRPKKVHVRRPKAPSSRPSSQPSTRPVKRTVTP